MISIKNKQAIEKMAQAGKKLAEIFKELKFFITAQMTTLEIDAWIEKQLQHYGLISQSKGYHGYQHVSCISVNDEVVHGVPGPLKKLQEGDLVKVDICVAYDGYCADMARCFFIGKPAPEAQRLVEVAQAALDKGIEKAVVGGFLSDISAAIQQEVEKHGYGVVREFAGHGIGKKMHEEPELLNYGKPGQGPKLRVGMALAIEPMITQGHYAVRILSDGWTVVTADKSLAAHVEDTVVITQTGPLIITR
ncbi:MAG: type I methionyl aminopeptidase [Candidatus Babeliaceae bacterium]